MVGNKHSIKYPKFFPKLHAMLVIHSQYSTAQKSKCIFNVLPIKLVIFFLNSSNKRSLATFPHKVYLRSHMKWTYSHKSIYVSKYCCEYTKEGNRHPRLKDKNEDTKCQKNSLTLK